MHENFHQLTESFAAHEYLAPDPVEVLQKAGLRARAYRRRRRAARATGASVLGAGIVAGSVALPGLKLHQGSSHLATGVLPASGNTLPIASSTPTPAPAPHTYTQQQELTEYFADGYNYDNAVALAALWHETDIAKVKADAGLKLLQGSNLPVAPSGTPEPAPQKAQEQAMNAFFAAGYGYDDAVSLGNLWNETDIGQVKADAGQRLLDGQTLPIPPSVSSAAPSVNLSLGPGVPESPQDKAVAAYFAAGYNYDDAVSLGKLWNQADTYQIKIEAGQKLIDGQPLPIAP